MKAARFEDVDVIDVTGAFLETARAWLAAFDQHEDELKHLIGDEWEERQRARREMILGIEEGLLHRVLVTGVA